MPSGAQKRFWRRIPFWREEKHLPFFEPARVLVRFDFGARFIVGANHGTM
jgi:hypothetical protein